MSDVPIDYTGRDYASLNTNLLAAIPTYLPEWTSTSPSDFGIVLLELMAYVGDVYNYYIDRVANEAFLTTAQQLSSVYNAAYLIDYTPQGATPGSAVLSVTAAAGAPSSFVIPAGAQFSTSSTATSPSLVFEVLSGYTFSATASPPTTTPTVTQGITVSNETIGISTGGASQIFPLFNTGVIESSVQVFVNEGTYVTMPDGSLQGPAWNMVTHLMDAGTDDSSFMLSIDANGVVYVNFGDNNNGRIPNQGATITATYRIGGGTATNVGANQITVVLGAPAYLGLSAPNFTNYIAAVSNALPASGGSDAETAAQIQANAPQTLTAAGRCVTAQDYATAALNAGGISKANAFSVVPSAVTLYVHPSGGPYLQSSLSTQVTALTPTLTNYSNTGYLDTRKMAGVSVAVLGPQDRTTYGPYVQVAITLSSLQALPQWSATVVQQNVIKALNELFDFGSMQFGQRISLGSVYQAIMTAPGVEYGIVQYCYRYDAGETSATLGDIVCGPSEIPVVTSPDYTTSMISVPLPTGGTP